MPSGPGFDNDNNMKLFNSLIYQARHRVSLTSSYFVPDESLLAAVTTAAERGVSVELFVSELGDQPLVFHAQRSYYEVLLRAGVRIYLHPAPYILHAKHFTIDDDVSVIGSSNMDMRSFGFNLEVVMMTIGREYNRAMQSLEDHYRGISRELTLSEHLVQSFATPCWTNNRPNSHTRAGHTPATSGAPTLVPVLPEEDNFDAVADRQSPLAFVAAHRENHGDVRFADVQERSTPSATRRTSDAN